MIQFWLRVNNCADSRLLSAKNDPVIKYACMQIRVLLCPELGTVGGGGGGGGQPIFANCPNLLFSKFWGGNSKFGLNWQKLAKNRFFLGYIF